MVTLAGARKPVTSASPAPSDAPLPLPLLGAAAAPAPFDTSDAMLLSSLLGKNALTCRFFPSCRPGRDLATRGARASETGYSVRTEQSDFDDDLKSPRQPVAPRFVPVLLAVFVAWKGCITPPDHVEMEYDDANEVEAAEPRRAPTKCVVGARASVASVVCHSRARRACRHRERAVFPLLRLRCCSSAWEAVQLTHGPTTPCHAMPLPTPVPPRNSKPRLADADTVAYIRELEVAMDSARDDPEQRELLVGNMHREVWRGGVVLGWWQWWPQPRACT